MKAEFLRVFNDHRDKGILQTDLPLASQVIPCSLYLYTFTYIPLPIYLCLYTYNYSYTYTYTYTYSIV
jgi:hypothetical protein